MVYMPYVAHTDGQFPDGYAETLSRVAWDLSPFRALVRSEGRHVDDRERLRYEQHAPHVSRIGHLANNVRKPCRREGRADGVPPPPLLVLLVTLMLVLLKRLLLLLLLIPLLDDRLLDPLAWYVLLYMLQKVYNQHACIMPLQ